MSAFRLAVVSLVDGHTRVSRDREPRIQTSRSKSSRRRSSVSEIVRLQTIAVVSLVDGHEFSSSIEPRFETSSVVSLVDGGF